jgi:hypothetical protein
MDLDAPQLRAINSIVADDGTACQLTLAGADGESHAFRLNYRQIGYLIHTIRGTVVEMRRRLVKNQQAATAEMIAGFAEAHTAINVLVAHEATTGDPTVHFETAEGTPVALRLSPQVIAELLSHLRASDPEGTMH